MKTARQTRTRLHQPEAASTPPIVLFPLPPNCVPHMLVGGHAIGMSPQGGSKGFRRGQSGIFELDLRDSLAMIVGIILAVIERAGDSPQPNSQAPISRPNGKVKNPAISSAPVTMPRTPPRWRLMLWLRAEKTMIGT